jgi:MtaA/CmuA family methyltransferase
MNSKQEIIDALNRENKGDAPPAIFTQSGTVPQMEACGCFWPEANFEVDKMIELALQPSKLLGFATARIPYDITSQAERLGCTVQKGTQNSQPAVISSLWNTGEFMDPPDFMSPDEFLAGGRVALYLEAAERISKEHPDLFLTSAMIGPQSVAAYLVGMENFLMGQFMEPDTMLKWVEAVAPHQYAYAHELSVRSDNVMVIVEGAEEVTPIESLDTFVVPFETELFKHINESFSLVHTCGETSNSMKVLANLGENILSVESRGDPQKIVDAVGDKVALAGGVDPIATLLQGTPESIVASAKQANEAGYQIIMPECGVPPATSNENLKALACYREM